MADNTIINPGSGGDAIATDDIGGVKFQRVKVTHGADGSATDVSSASPLPVDSELPAAAALADGASNPTTPLLGSVPLLWNNATLDRQRGNTEGTLLASGARTTTTQSGVLTNHNARGMIVYLNVTSAPANTETLTVYLSAWDPNSSAAAYVATGMIITGNEGAKMIAAMYAPGLATSADVIDANTGSRFRKTYNMIVPRSFFVTVFHSAGSSWTYSVNYSLTV